MDLHEKALLEGAFHTAPVFLMYGMCSEQRAILRAIEELRGPIEVVDLSDAKAVSSVKQGSGTTVVLLLGNSPSESVRQTIADRIQTIASGGTQVVVALSAERRPSTGIMEPFDLRICGMQVINEERDAAARLAEQHRAAQERARESSRRHGLS